MAITVNRVISFEGILSTAIYLAIGLAIYMWLGLPAGAVFSWAEPWLYIYALLWPFVVLWAFLKWAIIAVACIGAVVFLLHLSGRI